MRCAIQWALPLFFPFCVLAQDTGVSPAAEDSPAVDGVQAEAVALDPITVTATRTERSIYEVSESVSLISREQLDDYGAASLGEALSLANGVSLAGGPRANAQSVVLRGLSGTRVLMSVDGARQNYDGAHRSRLTLDPALLKSIDILRGPASALWGSDALGGVISLTTKDAADLLKDGELLGARLRMGSESADGERTRGGSVFGRLGSLDLLADLNTQTSEDIEQADGQRLPYSALDSQGSLIKLNNFFSTANELGVSLQSFRQQGQSPSNPSKDVTSDNPLLDRSNNQRYSTARYTYHDPSGAGRIAGGNLTLYRSALDVVEDRVGEPRHDTLAFATTGGSIQTTFNFSAAHSKLTLGGESYRDTARATRDGAPRAQFPDALRQVSGVFIQNEFALGQWNLTPGLRHDRYQSHSNTGAAQDISETARSAKLGAGYALTEWFTLSGVYGEAFRAPSLLESYAQGQHFLGNEFRPNPTLRPEKARNRELGFTLRFNELFGADDRWRLKFNAYDNRIRDYIETVVVVETQGPIPPATQCAPPAPAVGCVNRRADGSADPNVPVLIFVGGYTTSENLTQARIRGLELESSYALSDFDFTLAYAKTRGINAITGAPLLSIPANRLSASLGYRLFDTFKFGMRAVRASDQHDVPLLEDGTPAIARTQGYIVTSAFLNWQPLQFADGMALNFGADNLGNVLYRDHLSNFNEAGRSLRAALSYQF